MNGNSRSRIADLKVIGLVVSITIGLGTAAWGIVSWAQSLKPRAEARQDHEILHKRVSTAQDAAEKAMEHSKGVQQTVGRDVKTMKCILMAPNRRAKERCGLED